MSAPPIPPPPPPELVIGHLDGDRAPPGLTLRIEADPAHPGALVLVLGEHRYTVSSKELVRAVWAAAGLDLPPESLTLVSAPGFAGPGQAGTSAVYLVQGGRRHWLPSPAIAAQVAGADWASRIQYLSHAELFAIPDGGTHGGTV